MRHLDLFSGIGGFALAARWCSIGTVQFVEIDKFCQKVLNKNFPGVPIHDDIKSFRTDAIGRVDLLTGGFPCQPFSIAGQRRGREDDRDLWPEMFRVIKECKPTWIVGENVAQFINMEFDRSATDLEGEGYEVQAFVIPACGVNAPHKRDRVWIVAHSGHRDASRQPNEVQPALQVGQGTAIELERPDQRDGTGITADADTKQREWTERGRESLAPDGSQLATYSNSDREQQSKRDEREERRRFSDCCEAVTNTNRTRCEKHGPFRDEEKLAKPGGYVQPACNAYCELQQESRQHGLSFCEEEGRRRQTDRFINADWRKIEPCIRRGDDGLPRRVDRLRALGNTIVPQVVYPILKAIYEIEMSKS